MISHCILFHSRIQGTIPEYNGTNLIVSFYDFICPIFLAIAIDPLNEDTELHMGWVQNLVDLGMFTVFEALGLASTNPQIRFVHVQHQNLGFVLHPFVCELEVMDHVKFDDLPNLNMWIIHRYVKLLEDIFSSYSL